MQLPRTIFHQRNVNNNKRQNIGSPSPKFTEKLCYVKFQYLVKSILPCNSNISLIIKIINNFKTNFRVTKKHYFIIYIFLKKKQS